MATNKTNFTLRMTAIPLAALVLSLMLSLLAAIFTTNQAVSTPDEVKWSRVNIPTEGDAGNWMLASGSNVQHLTMAVDGTLYCYANPSGTSYTLFKSTDTGHSWSHTGQVTDAIVDIATAPDDASIIYYATVSHIYKSEDAGSNFTMLPLSPGGAGSENITITSLDIARQDGNSIIAVGTKDTDDSQYGGVYILDENEPLSGWLNTNIGNYDICTVAFSPNYVADRQLVAVVTDETDTLITTRIGNGDWGQISGDATIEGLVPVTTAVAFPEEYDATMEDYVLFIAIDTGSNNGDVYMLSGRRAPDSSIATDLNIGSVYNLNSVDVTSLAVSHSATSASILAGTANGTQIYFSSDSGINWERSKKKPTGQSTTRVLMAPDFASSGVAYAATGGTESGLSYTTDSGVTWKQIGLIDTKISSNGIIDVAISPNYTRDKAFFILTHDAEHLEYSLWRSLNDGAKWERVFTSTLAGANSLSLVRLSPQYDVDNQVVFLVGTCGGNSAIWKSTDNGKTFKQRGVRFTIDTWAAAGDNTLFLGSYDGSNGLVYRTTNGGISFSTGAVAGGQPLKSIALSPNYEQDETLLVSNTNGWVYYSTDNGTSFKPLPPDAASPPLDGSVTVAFDSRFSNNNTVYAASNSADKGIYRFIIDKSTNWESIDSTLPAGSKLSHISVSANGTLYATNIKTDNGMERCLNPTYSLGPTFETVTRGLEDGAILNGLWLRENRLWSTDIANTRLMTYTDSLTSPVTLTSPINEAQGINTGNINLDWATLGGATKYKWQLDYDTDFSTIPTGFEGEAKASSTRSPTVEAATTYYWRVRATEPVLSPWSAKWSFTTSLSSTFSDFEFYSPKAGATGVLMKPLFQWSAIAGAESYELLVSTDPSFSSPTIVRIGDYALPSTAWQSDVSLNHNTTYYWKIRGKGTSSYSAWSPVSAFTTALGPSQSPPAQEQSPPSSLSTLLPSQSSPAPPASPPPPPSSSPYPPTPSPPLAQSTSPNWVIYLVGALLLTTVLLLVTLLILVAGMRRS